MTLMEMYFSSMESGYQRKTAFEGQRVLNRVTAGEGVWGLERGVGDE